jgi:hypothetical protein
MTHRYGEDAIRSYSHHLRLSKPVGSLPLDLHVLSTPPAFILSQDQTLQKEF